MPSPLVPMADRQQRLLYTDAKGSKLVMYSDELLGTQGPMKLLQPGRLTDAQRATRTDLLAIPGAQITSLDSGITYESDGTTWKEATVFQQVKSVTASQVASPTAGMLADMAAVYRLNVSPFTRYYSNGTALVDVGSGGLDPEQQEQINTLTSEFEAAGEPGFVRTYTWASKPLPSAYMGTAFISDVGPRGSLWRSDGFTWGLIGGWCVLYTLNTAGAALTGSTATTPMVSIPIQAGLLGPNGALEIEVKYSFNNSVGNKTVVAILGTTSFGGVTANGSLTTSGARWNIQNRNSEAIQIGSNTSPHGLSSNVAAWNAGTENTATAKNLVISAILGTSTDTMTIEAVRVILVRP